MLLSFISRAPCVRPSDLVIWMTSVHGHSGSMYRRSGRLQSSRERRCSVACITIRFLECPLMAAHAGWPLARKLRFGRSYLDAYNSTISTVRPQRTKAKTEMSTVNVLGEALDDPP